MRTHFVDKTSVWDIFADKEKESLVEGTTLHFFRLPLVIVAVALCFAGRKISGDYCKNYYSDTFQTNLKSAEEQL